MKNILTLLIILFSFAYPSVATASEKPKTTISSVKQKGNDVVFTLTSSKKFIVGGNVYILHIGNRHFEESRNVSIKGKPAMAFIIPREDFNTLDEGAGIYLTYGHMGNDEEQEAPQIEAAAKQGSRRVWPMGAFSKAMLK